MFENVEEGYPDKEKPVKFYYNREERIAKAPEIVKKYYRGEMKPVRGIRVLFTGSNKYILFALIFFVAFVWIYNGFNKSRNYAKIQNVDCELTCYSFEDVIYTSVSFKWNPKTAAKDKADRNIKVDFKLIDADLQIVNVDSGEITILAEDSESKYIRFKNSDFDIIRCDIIVNIDGSEKELSTRVKR